MAWFIFIGPGFAEFTDFIFPLLKPAISPYVTGAISAHVSNARFVAVALAEGTADAGEKNSRHEKPPAVARSLERSSSVECSCGVRMTVGGQVNMKCMQMPMQHGQAPSGQMPADCQAMMQKMQAMHASAKAMDDRLATLVGEMNKARGSAKVDRMAAVINELVTQRKQMRTDMEAMLPQMMQHMTQHMQSGMMNGMQSMANCPMMSGASQATQQAAAPEHKH